MPLLSHAADGLVFIVQEPLCRRSAEGDNALGSYDFDFCPHEGKAGLHLQRSWFSIVGSLVFQRGPKFTDVGNVDAVPGKSHRHQDLIQFLPGFSNKGLASPFFLVARGFSNQHELSLRVARSKDHRVA